MLAIGIAVMDQPIADPMSAVIASSQRHLQHRGDYGRVLHCGGVPADDCLGEAVDHECDVDEPCPRSAIGEIGITHARFGAWAVKSRSSTSGVPRLSLSPGIVVRCCLPWPPLRSFVALQTVDGAGRPRHRHHRRLRDCRSPEIRNALRRARRWNAIEKAETLKAVLRSKHLTQSDRVTETYVCAGLSGVRMVFGEKHHR